MTITIVGGSNPSSPTFPVQRSVRLRSGAPAYFTRTFGVPISQNTWTYSVWVKRGALTGFQNIGPSPSGQNTQFYFDSSTNALGWVVNGGTCFLTTQVFRDPSAWYHIVLAFNGGAASNKVRLYVNGVEVTAFSTDNRSTTTTTSINTVVAHAIGTYIASITNNFDGYLTEINFVDGQQLTANSFGLYNSYGVWSPSKYIGTYGNNGFYLTFQDNSAPTAAAIGKDSSGNGNNWTPNNISLTAGVTYDSMLDVPTNTSTTNANFATLNPLRLGSVITASAGNLQYAASSGNSFCSSTIGMTSGKWYCEIFMTSAGTAALPGIVNENATTASYPGGNTNGYGYYYDGNKYTNGAGAAYGSSYTTNDIIGIALDLNAGRVWFSKNGTWQASGDPAAGTNAAFTGISLTNTWFFACGNSGVTTQNINFGQRPFSYTPPTGFNRLNTYNLPTPTIPNGAAQFAASPYTGTGATLKITTNFPVGVSWQKGRSAAQDNFIQDIVRGVSAGAVITNSTAAETGAGGVLVSSFDSDGVTFNANGNTNTLGNTYVAWLWNAGSTTVINTAGSIPSTIRANTTSGFSVVTWTGNGSTGTLGHGLGVVPKFIITKYRNAVNAWLCYHVSLGAGSRIYLNLTDAAGASATVWNNTSPTSSVFSVGDANTNASGGTYVAYCFADITGYSKFGSYTGNGSADGPFIYTGFRPRFVLIKYSSSIGGWQILDTSRSTYNVEVNRLNPNGSNAEATGFNVLDGLSNGFKIRDTDPSWNASGGTYIYAAFAENPFNYSLAR